MRPLLPHPIALEFPDIDADTFQDLMASMRKHGWNPDHPIVMFEGKILDGRNRYRCAAEINLRAKADKKIEPTFREFDGDREAAIVFSITENLLRRHLTAGQRALIGDGLANVTHGGKRILTDDQAANLPLDPITVEAAAQKVHVAPRTVRAARQLKALDPAAAGRVKNGKESLNGALTKAKKAAKKRAAPAEPVPETDDEGREIHPKAADALDAGRRRFRDLILRAQAIKREAASLAGEKIGRLLHRQTIETDFDNIARILKYAAPYTSCPLGDPCGPGCKLCQGTQWIGELQWQGVPKEMKKPNRRATDATAKLPA